jgi:peroxiredoxin
MVLVLFWCPVCGAADEKGDKAFSPGKTLPQFTLNAPVSAKERKYLSVKKGQSFSLTQIPAKIVVLEIFQVTCHHCRKQAPIINRVYKLIKQDPDMRNDIKMIGIAAKGTEDYVGLWKKQLRVPFPLFSDPELDIWKKIGKPGTPCTMVLSNSAKVLSCHLGEMKDALKFFKEIKAFYEKQ